MKTTMTITPTPTPKLNFPCFKRLLVEPATGVEQVVLFTFYTTGTVVHSKNATNTVGQTLNNWIDCNNKEIWVDFHGTITVE